MEDIVRDTLSPKWALEILSLLAEEGPLNYTEIEQQIPTSSDVVTKRLKELSGAGLVDRIEKHQRDVQYVLTHDGHAVLRLVQDIYHHINKNDQATY